MKSENIVIGIEGLVGTGKTSLCKELLKYIPNSVILHAGNVYRAVVYKILESKIEINKSELNIKKLIEKFKINVKIENNETVVYCGNEKIEEEKLQSNENSLAVSKISNIADNKEAYIFVKNIIDKLKEKNNIVFSGRDTMKIYPDLDYHFFITASLEERTRRKYNQYKNKVSKKEIEETIVKRDKLQEDSGYYNTYDNTEIIDVTDCKNAEESAKKVLDCIKIEARV